MAERRRDELQAFGLCQLRYVIAAADNGSFRKATIAIGVQESAIGRRIRDLEDEIGAALFVRGSSGVRLTHAGQLFIARARRAPESNQLCRY
ncbi:helix-turn-helix domain-containing protein [Bradyrhizobium uaiense]|nr:LysR family transcriptional regulator [Bradyrhizobium uaiense]